MSDSDPKPEPDAPPLVRLLTLDDIESLLVLEHRQWLPHQAATPQMLRARIERHPDLAIGAFCPRSGQALASLFLRPVNEAQVLASRRWHDCAEAVRMDESGDGLFGISLTSVSPQAVPPLQRRLWVQAIRRQAGAVFMGSPMPGLRRAREQSPALEAEAYARSTRRGMPIDPQLRYYHARGFSDIVAVLPDYFPHAESLDHGAVLRHRLPWAEWAAVLAQLPDTMLLAMADLHYGGGGRLAPGDAVVWPALTPA